MLCEMNMLATSDPEHHNVTAPSCLLSFTEMPRATVHIVTPQKTESSTLLKKPQTSYKIKPVAQSQLKLLLPRFTVCVTMRTCSAD